MPGSSKILLIAAGALMAVGAAVGVYAAFAVAAHDRDYLIRIAMPSTRAEIDLPIIEGPQDSSRPLVVIDAGHGGHDPGAGSGALREKDLTLSLAQALRNRLLAEGGIRVALTRNGDRYLMLAERSGIARRLNADLFLSIHADAAGSDGASGATVYTLSEQGSSEAAERFAARENRADRVNGVALDTTSEAVSAILVDLSQREALTKSDEFARLVLREGAGHILFRERPIQSAAFAVLKTPDMASVLFETGYISNADDVARLSSPEGREAFADATSRAIRAYFARQAHS